MKDAAGNTYWTPEYPFFISQEKEAPAYKKEGISAEERSFQKMWALQRKKNTLIRHGIAMMGKNKIPDKHLQRDSAYSLTGESDPQKTREQRQKDPEAMMILLAVSLPAVLLFLRFRTKKKGRLTP